MFANQKLLSYSLITIFLMLLNQQILFSIAQQNNLVSSFVDKSAEQLLSTNLWLKTSNSSAISHSSALPQSVSQSESRSQLIKASPISCYECNSYFDPDCITHPEKFQKNCTDSFEGSNYIGCRKIDQWVDYDEGEELKAHHRVIRQCAADGDISKPCYYRAGYGGRINACFCDQDLCNSGSQLKSNLEFILFIISSTFIGFRFQKLCK